VDSINRKCSCDSISMSCWKTSIYNKCKEIGNIFRQHIQVYNRETSTDWWASGHTFYIEVFVFNYSCMSKYVCLFISVYHVYSRIICIWLLSSGMCSHVVEGGGTRFIWDIGICPPTSWCCIPKEQNINSSHATNHLDVLRLLLLKVSQLKGSVCC
jgi:hypothetical protein